MTTPTFSTKDLFTLQNLKDWLNTSNVAFPATSDTVLARLVTTASLFATSYLQRQLQPTTYSEVRNGLDRRRMFLLNRPIISVTTLTVNTTVISARTQVGGSGYVFDENSLYLDGAGGFGVGYGFSSFPNGIQNVYITYRAGLQTSDVAAIPNPIAPLSVTSLSRPWNSDQGVTYANGTALTLVASSPAVGQYAVGRDSQGTAEYQFNATDAGSGIVISYGYTPEDIVQALCELAGERYKARQRIGEVSQTVGGQGTTVAFSQKDMNDTIRALLQPYKNVTPVAV